MEINVKVAVLVDLSEKTAAFIERLIGDRTSNPAVKEMAEKLDLEPVEISDNELREALDECRKRLLGAEPKKNPYYSVLTNFIRTLTADTYGAAVPREIAQERRQAFLDDLKAIENDNAGGYELPREKKSPF